MRTTIYLANIQQIAHQYHNWFLSLQNKATKVWIFKYPHHHHNSHVHFSLLENQDDNNFDGLKNGRMIKVNKNLF